MKRVLLPLFLLFVLSISYCRHDTSDLENGGDVFYKDVFVEDIRDVYIKDTYVEDIISRDTTPEDILTDQISDYREDILEDSSLDAKEDDAIMEDNAIEDVLADENIPGDDVLYDTEESDTEVISDIIEDTVPIDISEDYECKNECESPGQKECINKDAKDYVRECKDSDSDGCLEWKITEYCQYGCYNGSCKPCEPDCTNKECGDDGCGGSCGDCISVPSSYCLDINTLREYTGNSSCDNYKCVYEYRDTDCQYGCENGSCKSCTPDCTNKNCGSDGCGGSCGSCGDNQTCEDGVCKCLYEVCNSVCCGFEEVCFQNKCCLPDCGGKECGFDGCGGSCGNCQNGERCESGICVPINP